MPLVQEMMHPRGLSFVMQRKVIMLREVKHMSFPDIALEVRNLQGESPTAQCVSDYYDKFNARLGRARSKYGQCGRHAWKFTRETKAWIIKELLKLRKECVCTSVTLQHALARERGIKVSSSGVRRVLKEKGYKWLKRSGKRLYSKKDKAARVRFAKAVLRLTNPELREKLSLSMDGVVLTMPPQDATARYNYCRFGEDHIYRLPSEAMKPDMAGGDAYGKQAALARCVPLWGGISAGGFAVVCFHKSKKLQVEEWLTLLRSGGLKKSIKSLRPAKATGPWHVLCDNESFLHEKQANKLYAKVGLKMWHCPPRSPDLNPVELFWAWLRRKLRALDLKDAIADRPVLGKMAYTQRVRRVLKTKKAQTTAKNIALRLKKACRLVVKSGGAAIKG